MYGNGWIESIRNYGKVDGEMINYILMAPFILLGLAVFVLSLVGCLTETYKEEGLIGFIAPLIFILICLMFGFGFNNMLNGG